MMKKSVIPSGARDLAIAMAAFSSYARIDEGKAFQRYQDVFTAYAGSLGPSRTGIVCATRDDSVFQ
jgi:hypothetical protein